MDSPGVLATNILNISNWSLLTTCLLLTSVTIIATTLTRRKPANKVHDLGGISVFTAWKFFTARYDFLQQHLRSAGRKVFRFRVLQHRVFAGSGEDFRKILFSDAGLGLREGYRILMGSGPSIAAIDKEGGDEASSGLLKRLVLLLRKDRVGAALPSLTEDLNRKMKDWGAEGTINPFKEVYDLVFQMIVRMSTCRELGDDAESVQKLKRCYWDLEKSSTPTAVLLPWFPSPAKKKGKQATMDLYVLLKSYLDVRRKAEVPSSDPFDILIADGTPDDVIISTVMGIIFAGMVNTGMNSCWALLNLGANPTWKQKATDELKALVANHTDTVSSDLLHKRLSAIPTNAWEDELPSIDLVIRETLRLAVSGPALRRNLAKDITIDGTVVEFGDFMVYSFADVHLDPQVYTDPLKFDPGRYLEGREEDKKEAFAFVGWGAGRHPCAGVKLAKLEMKLILAMILLGYEYELVDKSGKFPQALPQPNRNDIQQARPLGEPCYLKFKRVVE